MFSFKQKMMFWFGRREQEMRLTTIEPSSA
jgi:hypothetical protein